MHVGGRPTACAILHILLSKAPTRVRLLNVCVCDLCWTPYFKSYAPFVGKAIVSAYMLAMQADDRHRQSQDLKNCHADPASR